MTDISLLKAKLPMPNLLSALGIHYKDKNHIKSPFREDKTPSLSVYETPKGWKFKDHGSGSEFAGDELDFIKLLNNTDTKTAIETYKKLCGVSDLNSETQHYRYVEKHVHHGKLPEQFDWDKHIEQLATSGYASKLKKFAQYRGYDFKFVEKLHGHRLLGWCSQQKTLCFPIQIAPNGRYSGAHYWYPNGSPRFKTKGSSYPWWIGKGDVVQVHVFESQFDAFAFLELMLWPEDWPDNVAVLITRSASNTRKVRDYVDNVERVFLHPQNDPKTEEGLTPAEKWTKDICESINSPLCVRIVETPRAYKDLNDWLKEDATHSALMETIERAKPYVSKDSKQELPAKGLPPIVNADNFMKSPCNEPEQVIGGVLHKGGKLVIGGGSKGRKTWSLLHLACAVSTGGKWWGFDCNQGRALYVNFELADYACHHRLRTIEEALNISGENSNLDLWNLRGHATDVKSVAPMITNQAQDRDYDLVILDPIYKLLGDRDENSAGDMTDLMNTLESIAVDIDSAIVFGHHYSKGAQADKKSMDRMSGSGVFARDPDAIVSLTDHSEEDCYVAECTLRNFAPIQAFGLRWDFPLLDYDPELDASDLKTTNKRVKYTFDNVYDHIPSTGVSKDGLYLRVNENTGMSRSSFNRVMAEAIRDEKCEVRSDGVVVIKRPQTV